MSTYPGTIPSESHPCTSSWRTIGGVAVALLLLLPSGMRAASDDFNSAPPLDAAWTQFDLRNAGFPDFVVDYSFPDDGEGGKAYKMQANQPPLPDAGPPRAVSYRSEIVSRFRVVTDVLDWNVNSDIAFGPATRLDNIGLGTSLGYLLNPNPSDQDLDITRVTGEEPTELADAILPFAPELGPYRIEFLGSSDALVGHVYRWADDRAPIASTAVIDQAYGSGEAGLIIFDDNDEWTGVNVTYDNFVAEALAANTPPQVLLYQPGHLTTATQVPAPMKVSIFDIEETVNVVDSSVQLEIDGVTVPNSALTITDGVELNDGEVAENLFGITVSYTPTSAPADLSGVRVAAVTFQDSAGNSTRKEWVFRYPVLDAANALPVGSGADPGFDVRMVQSTAAIPAEKSIYNAERQLAGNPEVPVDVEESESIGVINYTAKVVPNDPPDDFDGTFPDEATLPGIDPAGNTDHIAMEMLAYLELPAGTHELGVHCDDGFQLRSGETLSDANALILAQDIDSPFNGTFQVVVPEAGLYPFRLLWFERTGGAHVELFSIDPTSDERVLINDAASLIKAYRSVSVASVVLESATSVAGDYTVEDGADFTVAGEITVASSGETRYYRLSSAEQMRIGTIEPQPNGDIVMTYEPAQ